MSLDSRLVELLLFTFQSEYIWWLGITPYEYMTLYQVATYVADNKNLLLTRVNFVTACKEVHESVILGHCVLLF